MEVDYSKLFEDVDEYFIFHIFLVGDLRKRALNSCGGDRVGGENIWSEVACLFFVLDQNCFVHDKLFDELSGHKLGVAIVNDLINNFIDQHEILPNAFLVKHSAVVSEHFHHSVQDVHHIGR